jgi:hypothetical protein
MSQGQPCHNQDSHSRQLGLCQEHGQFDQNLEQILPGQSEKQCQLGQDLKQAVSQAGAGRRSTCHEQEKEQSGQVRSMVSQVKGRSRVYQVKGRSRSRSMRLKAQAGQSVMDRIRIS